MSDKSGSQGPSSPDELDATAAIPDSGPPPEPPIEPVVEPPEPVVAADEPDQPVVAAEVDEPTAGEVDEPAAGEFDEPAAGEFEAAEPDMVQPVALPGEQIEWQPVSSGDSIEWQPVMSGETEGGDAYPQEMDWEEPGAYGGDAAGAGAGVVAGNGAAGAGFSTMGPPPARPAGVRPKSVAARRRAQAAQPRAGAPAVPPGDVPPPDKTKRQVVILSVATLVVVAIGVTAFLLSRGALDEGDSANPAATPPTSTRTAPTLPESEMQLYRDEAVGFSVRYPKTWPKFVPPVGDVRLITQAGENDAFSVRVIPIQTPADEQNIGNFKAVTDAIVFGDLENKLIQEQLVRLNNHLTYYYLYTFEDEATRQQGVHAHYFVFEGLRMFSLVFQSVPADDFTRQAGIFDQVVESFVAEPPRPGATTTVPTTTTTVP